MFGIGAPEILVFLVLVAALVWLLTRMRRR